MTTDVAASAAPLEQLPIARELEGGFFVVTTDSTMWLVDTRQRRFQRHGHDVAVQDALTFGTWQPYERAQWQAPDTFLIVPTRSRVLIRCEKARVCRPRL
ncbi:MAG TPA: hypothetical protein VFX21_01655 [Acidimicrobiia bacterium]|nr:hypothetical protein [Acidimicrobiia bacterium]